MTNAKAGFSSSERTAVKQVLKLQRHREEITELAVIARII